MLAPQFFILLLSDDCLTTSSSLQPQEESYPSHADNRAYSLGVQKLIVVYSAMACPMNVKASIAINDDSVACAGHCLMSLEKELHSEV